jgi:hypothetical protein
MKIMKKYIASIILCGLLGAGCSDWLDVKPQSESTQEQIFQTQKGFRDALTGAYIRMKGGNIYGGSLMWGHIEYMARNWDIVGTNVALSNLQSGNYTDATVLSWMDNIYADLYRVIADVNSLLEEIDKKKAVFTDGNYELVKGEALALRAFCHFDLLRLFGPMPDDTGDGQILPYVKTVTKEVHPLLTYERYSQFILDDLNEAEVLLKAVDPVLKYSIADLNNFTNTTSYTGDFHSEDSYIGFRQIRMNYYAVLALKARGYLWLVPKGDTNRLNAIKYAQMVIDGVDQSGIPTFRLGEDRDRTGGDYTMSPEHIMALSVYNLETTANSLFGETGSLVRYDFNVTDGFYYLNNLFPVAERTSDIRWKEMWSYKTSQGNTNYVKFKKFIQTDNKKRQVPLLRLSEMYLILTECAATEADAEAIYAYYCEKKGIPFASGFADATWTADRRNKVLREYVREFYAEGQTFFTYKRLNVTTLPASWTYSYYTATPAKYIIPKPLREIEYHNK